MTVRISSRAAGALRLAVPASLGLLAACAGKDGREVFEARVVPALERSCASSRCHGVLPDAEASGEVIDWSRLFFHVDAQGKITDVDAAYEAAKAVVNTTEDPAFSTLVRKPMRIAYGGLPHAGGEQYASPQDADYQAMLEWIALEEGGGEAPEPLDELETLFAETVQPALISLSCANGNCHGPLAAVPFRIDPGLSGAFSIEATRANREAAIQMLALDGDPSQSRLLRKSLPLHDGGILHKGGNVSFLLESDDSRAADIRTWVCAERLARVGSPCLTGSEPPASGFVFVRGPVEPEDPFDLDVFVPGTDLHLATFAGTDLSDVDVVPLTETLHDGDADVRDPAIDPSGTRLAFAMRTSADRGHEIWEMDLATYEVRRLTESAGWLPGGVLATDRDPTWAADGRIWFTSTRAGVLADDGRRPDADLYELDPETGEVRRRSFTPHIERKPTFYAIGEETSATVAFTSLRDAIPEQRRAHPFRFPPGLATEYHQHFGITPVEDLFHDTREMPDGRYVTVIGDLENAWEGGRLGIVDRNFGPEMNENSISDAAALPFYAAPLVRLDPDAASSGETSGLYRDPAPLPDGRILVSYAPGPFDLGDEGGVPDLRIEVLSLTEGVDGSGPAIGARTVLVDEPGVADFDPEPLVLRAPPPLDAPLEWDPEAETALLFHMGAPMIDAILSNLSPSGEKVPRDDIVGMRLVEAIPTTPERRAPVAPELTRDGREGATTTTLGHHAPARVLAEIPLAADGTFQAEVPAGVAIRLQALDASGMAVGRMHNRWLDFHPGQTMRQGISAEDPVFYASRCAACHGAASGDPNEAFIEPDAMTMASVTLSRYESKDPRRPVDPPLCGEYTRVEVDFVRDVQPILDRSCATGGCHSGAEPAAGLGLSGAATDAYTDAYESLLARGEGSGSGMAYVDEPKGSARGSYLMEKVLGRELDAPRTLDTPGEAHPSGDDGAPSLTDADIRTLIRWIELGASFVGTGEGAP
ncbi:hypothetical protein L6R50_12990 [Myxococcota bacterium]|nr:hypothetical protein [Myxococcota bacterium]